MKSAILTFAGLLFVSSFQSGDKPIRIKVMEALAQRYKVLPQEKVYLHLDKPYYHPRDTIWFKAYLVDAMHHHPDSASRVLNVDLYDERLGTLISNNFVKIDLGFGSGYMDIPDNLPDGRYQIRAYTNWMRNCPEFIFIKDIQVYNYVSQTLDAAQLKELTTLYALDFFPEGGDLVEGLNSRVAFKAVNQAGKGIDARGFILNSRNDTVVTFQSSHLGMGYFNFKPAAGENYSAFVRMGKGMVKPIPLPAPLKTGIVMALDNITRKDEIKVFIAHNYTDKKNLTMIAQQRGLVRFAADMNDTKGSFIVRVGKNNFPTSGIVQFTLFNEEGLPLCERLVFIQQDEDLVAEIKTNKSVYRPREKVEVEITVRDISGEEVAGNFSLAVTDKNQVQQETDTENIYTYLLLSSDASPLGANNPGIRGTIEQPAWYFNKSNSSGPTYLDLLLMTQGWRRFIWSDLLNNPVVDTTNRIESGLSVSGTLLPKNGKPHKEPVPFTLIFTDENESSQLAKGIAGINGKFNIPNLDFSGKTIIEGRLEVNKKMELTFDSLSLFPIVRQNRPPESFWVPDEVIKHFLERERQKAEYNFNQSKMLNPVVIESKKIERVDPRRNITPIPEKQNVLTPNETDCAGAISVLQMLQGKISGLRIVLDRGIYKAQIRSTNTFGQGFGTTEPLYLVDGFPVDASFVNNITPCNVEKIEVFKNPLAMYGASANSGAIAFYTRVGTTIDGVSISQLKQRKLVRNGFVTKRQFYSPRYDDASSSGQVDFRSVIYWSPSIITNRYGKAKVEFWNSDEKETEIMMILEGMDYHGKFVAAHFTYKVQ